MIRLAKYLSNDGKRPSLDVTFTRGVQGRKLNLPLRGTPASTGRRIWPAGGRLPWVFNFGFQGLFRALHFCTTSSIQINILHIVCERCMRFGCVKFCFFFIFFWAVLNFGFSVLNFGFCSRLERFDPSFWSQSPPKTRSRDPKTVPIGAQRAPKTHLRPKFKTLGSTEGMRDEFGSKFKMACV